MDNEDFSDVFLDSPIPYYDSSEEEEMNYSHIISSSPIQLIESFMNFDNVFLDSPIPIEDTAEVDNSVMSADTSTPNLPIDSSAVTSEIGTESVNHSGNEDYPSFMDIEDVSTQEAQQLMDEDSLRNNLQPLPNFRRQRAYQRRPQLGGAALEEQQPPLFFTMTPISENVHRISDFNHSVYSTTYNIQHNFHQYVDLFAVEKEIDDLFTSIVAQKISNAHSLDIVTLTIHHERLNTPIYVSSKKNSFDPQNFLNAIYEVCQSDRTMILNGEMQVVVEITEHIQGSALMKTPLTVSQWRRLRKCIVTLQNIDSRCGYYAIALGLFYTSNPNTTQKRDLRENRRERLTHLTDTFCRDANLDINVALGVETYSVVDTYLKTQNIRFFVVNGETKNCFFKSADIQPKEIFIELYQNHYYLITSIESYTENRYFCRQCWVGYSHLNEHRCRLGCDKCNQSVGCVGDLITCSFCQRSFKGQLCFNAHKSSKLCQTRKQCPVCEVEYQFRKGHTCGKYICTKCGDEYEETPHYCYIKRKDINKLLEEDAKNQILVCLDIESRFESPEAVNGSVQRRHTAMCLCARVVCNQCYSFETNDKIYTPDGVDFCPVCKAGTLIYEGVSCVKNFGDYLYNCLAKIADEANAKLIVLAHNFKGYDGHFIMRDLFERRFTKIVPIMNGSKILKLTVGNVTFIDSLSFLPMALAKLPKVFNFESRAMKGYYPYLFNTLENENYVGRIPPLTDFGSAKMLPDELAKLTAWHNSVKNELFDLKAETRKYCKNDADILMIAVMNFKKQFVEITTLNPLTRNFTLASMCLEVFRAKVLRDNKTLGVTPLSGYNPRKSSVNENVWLDVLQQSYNNPIKRQYKIGKYYADGFVEDNDQKIAFEYWGCYFHGCSNCYDGERILANNQNAEALRVKVQEKRLYYERRHVSLVEIWECQFKEIYENSSDVFVRERIQFYKDLNTVGGVNIREAFLGGRTNNLRFYYNAAENEEIKYKDVVSLYPTVLKKCYFPVGHPVMINNDFDYTLESYVEGFVKCIVLPPKECYVPILGQKSHDRLLFPLCKICSAEKSCVDCQHTDEERSLICTFTMPELRYAIQNLGYKIVKIFQVANYVESRNDIFVDYVKMFQKVKQEASGLPAGIITPEQIRDFVESFERHEDIRLDPAKIELNSGKRDSAKQSLNGLWGKLSQKPNLPQTVVCSDYTHFWNLLNNEEVEILGHTFPNDNTVVVNYRKRVTEDCEEGNTSLATAAYVTAHARLYLYGIIEKVIRNGYDRLLYFDTDSVIYVFKEGDQDLETGCYFGQLTDEIAKYGENAKGTKFVSCGPKNYGLEIETNGVKKTSIKTKGIRYDAACLELIQLETMVEMAKKYIEGTADERKLMQWRIRSNSRDHFVDTVEFEKVYRCVSEKRRIIGNGTVPYGFKGNLPYIC